MEKVADDGTTCLLLSFRGTGAHTAVVSGQQVGSELSRIRSRFLPGPCWWPPATLSPTAGDDAGSPVKKPRVTVRLPPLPRR